MRKKFLENELTEVKKRWKILTFVELIFIVLIVPTNFSDRDALITLGLNIGDVTIVLIVMSLLGRKWKSIHHYSIIVCIFVRILSQLA